VAGVIVNAAGLAAGGDTANVIAASNWLYWLFAIAPLIAIPVLWSVARNGQPAGVAAVEQPAE
jgi:hypothetical protein